MHLLIRPIVPKLSDTNLNERVDFMIKFYGENPNLYQAKTTREIISAARFMVWIFQLIMSYKSTF